MSKRIRDHKTIGRLYTVNPRNQELYCLRLLLLRIPGATSYDSLKTVNGILHNTFKDAAIAINLIFNDEEFRRAIAEAIVVEMPKQLRHLFAICCIFNTPTNAREVWEEFRQYFIHDYSHRYDETIAISLALRDIDEYLRINNFSLLHFNLPNYNHDILQNFEDNAIDLLNEIDDLITLTESVHLLNAQQMTIFNDVMNFVNNNEHRLLFIDAPGGTGKTFLLNQIYASLTINKNKNVMCVAWTGIAACLLPKGVTAQCI